MTRRALLALFSAPAVVLVPGIARAVDVTGIRFADNVTIGGTPLVLNGVGVRRVTILGIKVYVAGLYITKRTRSGAEILRADRPKYYVAVMKRDVSRDDSAPVFRENIERSAGPEAAAIRSEITAFERWMPSMREGQRLTVSFTPDSGVIVRSTAKADAFSGSVRFGTALFGVWIGPRAADAAFRDALLSGAPPAFFRAPTENRKGLQRSSTHVRRGHYRLQRATHFRVVGEIYVPPNGGQSPDSLTLRARGSRSSQDFLRGVAVLGGHANRESVASG